MGKSKKIKKISTYLLIDQGARIDRAFKKAVREALLRHKQAGNPVAVWQEGKVTLLRPEDLDLSK